MENKISYVPTFTNLKCFHSLSSNVNLNNLINNFNSIRSYLINLKCITPVNAINPTENGVILNLVTARSLFPDEAWFMLYAFKAFLGCRSRALSSGLPLQPSDEHLHAWVKSATREYFDCFFKDLFIQSLYWAFWMFVIFLHPSSIIPRIVKPWSSLPAQLFAMKDPVMLIQCVHPPEQSCNPVLHSIISNLL